MKLAHINVRSLLANYHAFKQYFDKHHCDMIAVSETWLTGEVGDSAIRFSPDMNMVRRDRGGRGGGVALFVHRDIKFKLLEFNLSINSFEYLLVSIIINREQEYVLCVIYRSSSLKDFGKFYEDFETLCSCILATTDRFLCIGDINIDLLQVTSNMQQYSDLLDSFNLTQVVAKPTRVSATSSTLLDHIIVSDTSFVENVDVDLNHSISDHGVIICNLKLNHEAKNLFL